MFQYYRKKILKTYSGKNNLILNTDVLQFKGDTTFPMSIQNLSTPYQFFTHFASFFFFDDELVARIVDE